MPPITADFTLTYEEFIEAHRLQQRRKRFLAGPPPRSPWIGCGMIAALFLLTFVAVVVATYATGRTIVAPGGAAYVQSDALLVVFLWGLLPYIAVAGVAWLLLARSTIERRMLWRIVLVLIGFGIVSALTIALTHTPAPADNTATPAASLVAYLPMLLVAAGVIVLLPALRRGMIRVAWDGQPNIRRPVHLEATPDRLLVQTAVSRHEYQWASFVTYSEGANVFVLSVSALSYQAIPKRAFGDASQVEAFRALVRSRMVDADAQPQGFDVLPVQAAAPVPVALSPPPPPPPLQPADRSEPGLPPGPSQ
jgi:hypothetical protein